MRWQIGTQLGENMYDTRTCQKGTIDIAIHSKPEANGILWCGNNWLIEFAKIEFEYSRNVVGVVTPIHVVISLDQLFADFTYNCLISCQKNSDKELLKDSISAWTIRTRSGFRVLQRIMAFLTIIRCVSAGFRVQVSTWNVGYVRSCDGSVLGLWWEGVYV